MKSTTAIIISLLAIILLWGGCSYNKMVKTGEGTSAKWADVESEYQRRSDLIPNLVAVVKNYADFEKSTLEAVISARAKATSTEIKVDANNLNEDQIAKFQQAQDNLSGALNRLLVTVERYPDLKANQNFLALQTQLEGTENRIKVARNNFNEAVQSYNTYIKTFPQNIFARLFGFQPKGYFKSQPGSESAPDVKDLFKDK